MKDENLQELRAKLQKLCPNREADIFLSQTKLLFFLRFNLTLQLLKLWSYFGTLFPGISFGLG